MYVPMCANDKKERTNLEFIRRILRAEMLLRDIAGVIAHLETPSKRQKRGLCGTDWSEGWGGEVEEGKMEKTEKFLSWRI